MCWKVFFYKSLSRVEWQQKSRFRFEVKVKMNFECPQTLMFKEPGNFESCVSADVIQNLYNNFFR